MVGHIRYHAGNGAIAANGVTGALDIRGFPFVTVMGNASAATTISVQGSEDGTTFFVLDTVVLSGAGDFALNLTVGVSYLQLKSSAAATINAYVSAEG